MSFSTIPARENSREILASWFNVLRTAGIAIEQYLGTTVAETQVALVNNQLVAANVSGLTLDPAAVRAFTADYVIYRNTTAAGATELAEYGTLKAVYSAVAGTWELAQDRVGDAGVTLTITNAGQVQYTSSNITGTPDASWVKFKARTFGV